MFNPYKEFIMEILNLEIIEESNAFGLYKIIQNGKEKELNIKLIYINKKERGNNNSVVLLDTLKKIAIDNNCDILSADISKEFSEFIQQKSIHICRLYGMNKVYEDNKIYTYSRGL